MVWWQWIAIPVLLVIIIRQIIGIRDCKRRHAASKRWFEEQMDRIEEEEEDG
jgi:hypothetical protein